MRLEILLTSILFFGGTYLTGHALCCILKLENEGIFFSILSGTMLWWAMLELILMPMVRVMVPFHKMVFVYTIMIVATAVTGCLFWKGILHDFRNLLREGKNYLTLCHVIAFVLICYQLYFIHHHMYLEWDDTYYVNLANVAVSSDQIYWIYPETGTLASFDKRYVLSLWPIFYAWLSRLIGVSPTIMAHLIFPWLMIPLAYMVYVLTGKELFPYDKQMQGIFLTLAVLVHLFMSGVHTSGLTFLSITPWIGKGILASVLLPALLLLILRIAMKNYLGDWVLLGITCYGGCLISSMGIMLMPVFVGLTIVAVTFVRKNVQYLLRGIVACFPCALLGMCYIFLSYQ